MKWPWARKPSRKQELSDYFDGVAGRRRRELAEAAVSDPTARRQLADYARLRDAVRRDVASFDSRADPQADPQADSQTDAEYAAGVLRRIEDSSGRSVLEEPHGWPVWRLTGGGALAAAALVVAWRLLPVGDIGVDTQELGSSAPVVDAERRRTADEPAIPEARASAAATALEADAREAVSDTSLAKPSDPLARLTDASTSSRRTAGAARDAPVREDAPAVGFAVARFATATTLLPYTLRVVDEGSTFGTVGMQVGAELGFSRLGARHAVSLDRDDDGNWVIRSEYTRDGELLTAESRERRFRLDDSAALESSDGALARFRIAQPLVGSARLYAVVVGTEGFRPDARADTPMERSSDGTE